jgi:hypothetical protein
MIMYGSSSATERMEAATVDDPRLREIDRREPEGKTRDLC